MLGVQEFQKGIEDAVFTHGHGTKAGSQVDAQETVRVASLYEYFQHETPELTGGTVGNSKEQCDPNGLPGEAGSVNSQRDSEPMNGQIEQKTTMTQEEFERAVTKFSPRLVWYMKSLGRDPADAEDIVQDALIELVEKKKYESFTGNDDAAIFAWLKEAVKYSNLRFGTMAQKESLFEPLPSDEELSESGEHSYWEQLKDQRKTPEESAQSRELEVPVNKALNDLPPDIRDAIVRHYVKDEPLKTIAKEMGLNEKTLGSMLQPHLARLRERLKDFAPAVQKKERDNIAS